MKFLNFGKKLEQDDLALARDRLLHYLNTNRQKLTSTEVETLNALQEKLDKSIIEIATFGLVSRGKTAVINALLGKKIGETGAVHGVTKSVMAVEWQKLKLIDTPGLDEVDGEARSQMAKQVAQSADLILFVIAGDMTRLEQEAIAQLRLAYKPILLVFNKIDLYPESDRHEIHAALQDEAVQELISPSEIVLTAAEPMPLKVRIQYANSQDTQEVWEDATPQIQTLKLKILELLNREGKSLLAVNVMRALAEVQNAVTQRHLQAMPRVRSLASVMFVVKAIALGISPWFWLDILCAGAIDVLTFAFLVRDFPLTQKPLWGSAILANAFLSAAWGLESQLTQIGWTGITFPLMLQWLSLELQHSSTWGRWGAKALIQQICQRADSGSILSRIAKMHS